MKFLQFLQFAAIAPIFYLAAASAQDADDEAITVLDQVVPVADAGPPEEDPIIEPVTERVFFPPSISKVWNLQKRDCSRN